jgi:hypothetical protein
VTIVTILAQDRADDIRVDAAVVGRFDARFVGAGDLELERAEAQRAKRCRQARNEDSLPIRHAA